MELETWHVLTSLGLILIILDITVLMSTIVFPTGLGLLLTALASIWITNLTWLIYIGCFCIVICYLPCYFIFKRLRAETPQAFTPMDRYIGKTVTVNTKITDKQSGEVQIYGETWRAYSAVTDVIFHPEDQAVIQNVRGNELLITISSSAPYISTP